MLVGHRAVGAIQQCAGKLLEVDGGKIRLWGGIELPASPDGEAMCSDLVGKRIIVDIVSGYVVKAGVDDSLDHLIGDGTRAARE